MRWSGALVAAVVLVTAAGCSGDDDADAAVTTVEESTTTTTPPTTTTTAATTTPPTTIPDTTAPTTSTAAPTTTTASTTTTTTASDDDYASQAIAVIDRTEESWDVVLIAFGDPFDEDKASALEEFFTGNQLEGFNNLLEEFRVGNFRSVARPETPEVYVADPRSLTLNLTEGFATVQVCHIDTSLIVETGGNADGTDRVVADEIEQEIVELDVVRVDGVWKIESARAPETEIARCP